MGARPSYVPLRRVTLVAHRHRRNGQSEEGSVGTWSEVLVHDRPTSAVAPRHLARSIVIPAYCEQERLPRTLAALAPNLDPQTTELIVVDDGSTDATAEVADELLADWPHGRRLGLGTNRGKGAAVRAGVLACRGRRVAFLDADSATDSACLHDLFGALDHADVAIGSRALSESVVERYHRDRAVMGWAFNVLVRSATGVPWRDTQCGFKAFRTPVAKILFALGSIDGFAFDVELLDLAHRLGLRTVEVPVRWQHVEGSKVRHMRDSATMTYDVVRAARSEHRRPIECLHLEVPGHRDVNAMLNDLSDDVVLSRDRGTLEIVVPPGDPTGRASTVEELGTRGIEFEPVVRSGTEVIERCRWGDLSLGVADTASRPDDQAEHRTPGDVCRDAAAGMVRRSVAAVGRRPTVLGLLVRCAPPGREGRMGAATQLAIEGYYRSGTTFVATALRQASQEGLALVHHVHQPAQVSLSVRYGIPALVLVRRPLEAAASVLSARPNQRPQQVLRSYISYHEQLLPYLDDVEIADFGDAVADLRPVIHRLNRRFDLRIPDFEHTSRNVDRVFAAIDERHGDRHRRGDSERDVPRPSPARARRAARHRAELEHPTLSGMVEEASHLHDLFVSASAHL
jgi:hypothetical protein